MGFGRACAPMRCAHPSFLGSLTCPCQTGRCAPPPAFAASLILIYPPKLFLRPELGPPGVRISIHWAKLHPSELHCIYWATLHPIELWVHAPGLMGDLKKLPWGLPFTADGLMDVFWNAAQGSWELSETPKTPPVYSWRPHGSFWTPSQALWRL